MDARRRAGWTAIGVLAVTHYLGVVLLGWGPDQIYFGGDQAGLVERAERLLRGDLLRTGIPSVTGPDHPGPLYLYFLGLLLALGGGTPQGLVLGAAALKSAFFAVVGGLILRGSHSAISATTVVLLLMGSDQIAFYIKVLWVPGLVLVMLAAALGLTASVWSGRVWALPGWAFTLSYIAQSHTSQVPQAIVLAAAGGIGLVATRGRESHPSPALRLPLSATCLVVLVLWAPPAYEAARNQGGNLLRLVQFYAQSAGENDASGTLAVLTTMSRDLLPMSAGLWAFLLALCSISALHWALRHGSPAKNRWARNLVLTVHLAWFSFLLSAFRIPGRPETHHLMAFYVLAPALLGLGLACLSAALQMRQWRALALSARLILLLSLGTMGVVRFADRVAAHSATDWNAFPFGQMELVSQRIKRESAGRRVFLLASGRNGPGSILPFAYLFARMDIPFGLPRDAQAFFWVESPCGKETVAKPNLRTRSLCLHEIGPHEVMVRAGNHW